MADGNKTNFLRTKAAFFSTVLNVTKLGLTKMTRSGKGLIKIFINSLRFFGTISCILTFLLWSKLAIEKLVSMPISSTITYKNGDDGKGLIEHPIVTVCPKELNYFTIFKGPKGVYDAHCKCSTTIFHAFSCRFNYLWSDVFKDCFGKNGFESINASTKELHYELHPLVIQLKYGKQFRVPKDPFHALMPTAISLKRKRAVFHPFFHERYGTCWSFDVAKEINAFVEPEEMTIDFGVRIMSFFINHHESMNKANSLIG